MLAVGMEDEGAAYNNLYEEVINISDGDDDDLNVHVDHSDDDGVEIVQNAIDFDNPEIIEELLDISSCQSLILHVTP
jgi:hypothetical protein